MDNVQMIYLMFLILAVSHDTTEAHSRPEGNIDRIELRSIGIATLWVRWKLRIESHQGWIPAEIVVGLGCKESAGFE